MLFSPDSGPAAPEGNSDFQDLMKEIGELRDALHNQGNSMGNPPGNPPGAPSGPGRGPPVSQVSAFRCWR